MEEEAGEAFEVMRAVRQGSSGEQPSMNNEKEDVVLIKAPDDTGGRGPAPNVTATPCVRGRHEVLKRGYLQGAEGEANQSQDQRL